jgi:hypothetical protein
MGPCSAGQSSGGVSTAAWSHAVCLERGAVAGHPVQVGIGCPPVATEGADYPAGDAGWSSGGVGTAAWDCAV